ncbi:oxygenase MpaB family protein [Gordonia sp. ABSL1-1]|uniref:oxygenase MpaB family protein n=1 Tax=Gordonia sp. ABSL1-1 TaxID=3053923 RepID=UPI0025748DEC|nr:oxygenase MpaB family protein [Gordonia sp. ABSL1-1]MDL9935722.1 oxygenase MpaB family protein [Gordonia sp. ABSL1-1]
MSPVRIPKIDAVRIPKLPAVPIGLPHQVIGRWLNDRFDENIRTKFFRGMDFENPAGDPGWFGPDSATWYVHSHTPALLFGLQCASYLERLDPSIYWMGMHHSRLVTRADSPDAPVRVDPEGANIRLGHSLAFFMGTAYGSTETAERLARTVRAMHHTIKGVRPDGLAYDADDPAWLRWNYATVVWGIATAHEIYHPKPLRGDDLERYYREFVRVGHALGGTDLPETKADTLECLKEYLPKLGLTYGNAAATGSNITNPAQAAVDWAIRDTMPTWAAKLVLHQRPNPVERRARRSAVWAAINGVHLSMGEAPEFAAARRRVAAGTTVPHTLPTYVLGTDPELDRDEVEAAFS